MKKTYEEATITPSQIAGIRGIIAIFSILALVIAFYVQDEGKHEDAKKIIAASTSTFLLTRNMKEIPTEYQFTKPKTQSINATGFVENSGMAIIRKDTFYPEEISLDIARFDSTPNATRYYFSEVSIVKSTRGYTLIDIDVPINCFSYKQQTSMLESAGYVLYQYKNIIFKLDQSASSIEGDLLEELANIVAKKLKEA